MQGMYIRIKRNKTTYFIPCLPTEKTLQIKEKLQVLIDQPVADQRLILLATGEVLDDAKSLADQKVLLHLCHPLNWQYNSFVVAITSIVQYFRMVEVICPVLG